MNSEIKEKEFGQVVKDKQKIIPENKWNSFLRTKMISWLIKEKKIENIVFIMNRFIMEKESLMNLWMKSLVNN